MKNIRFKMPKINP